MSNFTNFSGHHIGLEKVVAVEPVTTHPLDGQWEYGFIVRLQGNTVTVTLPQPSGYGYSHGPSREVYLASAGKLRDKFIALLK